MFFFLRCATKSYDAAKDLAPVVNLVNMTNLVVANRDLPARSMKELADLARAKPGEINYGSLGLGSVPHLHTEAFASRAGVKLTHIPYKGLTDVMPAMMANQIQIALSGMAFVLPLIKDGKIKALGVGSPQRSPKLPDVPTFGESGFPGLESQTWFGLLAPAATPRNVVAKIAADIGGVISQKAFVDKYVTPVDFELLNQGPEEFARVIAADRATYARHVKALNIRLD
jgi:tripartite-type tricarboxylate transporter receptor subunit TctC